MKSFLYRSLLFVLPILAAAFLLFTIPYSRKFAYLSKSNEDCNTSWIYHRLFENPANIDIAFIGSSHTGCGIDDVLIEKNITANYGKQVNVANIAYCGGGRNLDYIVLKDLLKEKTPKTIIIELKNNNDLIHKDYGIMASGYDLWIPPAFPSNYFPTLYTGIKSRLNNLRENLVFGSIMEIDVKRDANGMVVMKEEYQHKIPHKKKKKIIFTINEKANHSFFGVFKDSISEAKIEEHLRKKQKIRYDDIECVREMVAIAKEKKVKVFFLYIPSFRNYFYEQLSISEYSKMGTILFPPQELFNKKGWWLDQEHFNIAGASAFSEWVSSQYKQLLNE
ncbi:MAG: hypothetical protein ACT4ON_08860 [Bacteroidota bacterium]